MQIKVIRSFADAEFHTGFKVGEVLNLEDKKKARSLIASGFATPVIDGPENASAFKNNKGK
jgi:hypothetical protein